MCQRTNAWSRRNIVNNMSVLREMVCHNPERNLLESKEDIPREIFLYDVDMLKVPKALQESSSCTK